jgi:hypothetical protein
MTATRVALVARLAIFLVLGGRDWSRKRLPGDYCLDHDNGSYRVEACGLAGPTLGGPDGPFGGVISNIGWDDRYIVVWRVPRSADGRGYMILDTQLRTVEGPYSRTEYAESLRRTPALQRIEVGYPQEAMKKWW